MKKVIIKPGCIACGACAFMVPEVFELHATACVKKDADIEKHQERIKKAAQDCPVNVIVYE